MAPLRIAALTLGSLALLGGSPANGAEKPAGTYVTDNVKQWFNLLRNGKIDYPLPNLESVEPDEPDSTDTFFEGILEISGDELPGPVQRKKTCTLKNQNDIKGLVLELEDTAELKYAKALDKALETALPALMKTAQEDGGYNEIKANSISFLASRDTTGFTCAETSDCETAYLVCKFQGPAKATTYLAKYVSVSKEFVEAAEARKEAGVDIEGLTTEDSFKPLTPPPSPESGVSKPAVSASVLAALAAAVAAVIT